MYIHDFKLINLVYGDLIWIMNEKGERFHGCYLGNFDLSRQTFLFSNYSNGQTEKIEIGMLQGLDIDRRIKP